MVCEVKSDRTRVKLAFNFKVVLKALNAESKKVERQVTGPRAATSTELGTRTLAGFVYLSIPARR